MGSVVRRTSMAVAAVVTVVAALGVVPQANAARPAQDVPVPELLATPAIARASAALAGGDLDNRQLAWVLDLLERMSGGRVDVRGVGTSNEGRPVHFATVGTGPVRILYVTQQHGDEPLGTPAAVAALWTLGVLDTPWARQIRNQVTLGIIVRANPDGHERDWRHNYDPDADPEFGRRGEGYDINRYHNPGLAPEDNPVPEAAAIQRTYQAMRPSIVVDYHMQERYQFPDGHPITTSILWPTNPGASPDAVNRSKQLAVLTNEVLTRWLGAGVSQYPGGDYEGIGRNAYGMLGSASLLFELSDLGEQQRQFQITSAYLSMLAVAAAAGDGSLTRIDPAKASQIPPRGPLDPDAQAEPESDHLDDSRHVQPLPVTLDRGGEAESFRAWTAEDIPLGQRRLHDAPEVDEPPQVIRWTGPASVTSAHAPS